jgi:hypothetical protein
MTETTTTTRFLSSYRIITILVAIVAGVIISWLIFGILAQPQPRIMQEKIPIVPEHKLMKLDICKMEAIICLPEEQKNLSSVYVGPNASI